MTRTLEDFDNDLDLYKDFVAMGVDDTKKHLDGMYQYVNFDEVDIVDHIKSEKKGGYFGNADYQVTQPAHRYLCENSEPYKNRKDICDIENIKDEEAYVAPVSPVIEKTLKFIILLVFISFSYKIGTSVGLIFNHRFGQKKKKKRTRSRRVR